MNAIGGPPHIRHFLLHFLRMPGLYIFWPLAQQPSKSGFMLFVWKPYCMAFKRGQRLQTSRSMVVYCVEKYVVAIPSVLLHRCVFPCVLESSEYISKWTLVLESVWCFS